MNDNKIAVFDFETGGLNPLRCQPIQLSCVMIDGIKLEVIDDSIFDTYIKAEEDPDKCAELGIDLVSQEALDKNKITWDQIRGGVALPEAWGNFSTYTLAYAKTKRNWHQPIRAGFNTVNFDNKIVDRMCEIHGPWDSTYFSQKIFHPSINIDVMHDVYRWTEGQNFKSISFDSVREWMGINPEHAHNSKKDVLDCAYLIIKFLRLYRHLYSKIKFEDCFQAENELIAAAMRK